MVEKFVTPGPLPTPHENEILVILGEECCEIGQRTAKAQRFGLGEIQPGHEHTNSERASQEVGDLLGVIDMAIARGILHPEIIDAFRAMKPARLAKYMQTEPPNPSHVATPQEG